MADNIVVEQQTLSFNLPQSAACVLETSVPLSGGNPTGGVYIGPGVSGTIFNPSAAGIGTHQITYTFTTEGGCVSSVTENFTLRMISQTPIAICADITIYIDTSGTASILPEALNNGSNDECSSVQLSVTQTLFNCEDLGGNATLLTVTDQSGNEANCISTVTVADTASNCYTCYVQDISIDAGWNIISGNIILT